MKKIIILSILLCCGTMNAQEIKIPHLYLQEVKVVNMEIAKTTFPIFNSFVKKAMGVVVNQRLSHMGESGRVYTISTHESEADLYKYFELRNGVFENMNAIMKENRTQLINNEAGPSIRSVWEMLPELSNTWAKEFKSEDFDFRKIEMFTIPFGKEKEYFETEIKLNKMDAELGNKHYYVIFRAAEGYPTNTYLEILLDKSLLDYYNHRDERNAKRNLVFNTLSFKNRALINSIRIDHLSLMKQE